MNIRWIGVATLVCAFSGCGAENGQSGDDGAPLESEVSSPATLACVGITATLDAHVTAGRATVQTVQFFIFTFKTYFAAGTGEQLGTNGGQQVTLYRSIRGGFTANQANCSQCGDGAIQPPEMCEGTNLGGNTCLTLGHSLGGTLACDQDCNFDQSNCHDSVCGNAKLENGEECDGADLAGATCVTRGFVGGTLACASNCVYDATHCVASNCGDGHVDHGEECDGTDFGSRPTCLDQGDGWIGGKLKCSATCGWDLSECIPSCGDGKVDAVVEQCDGSARSAEFAGKSCKDLPYPDVTWPWNTRINYGSGELTCSACQISFANCKPVPGCYFRRASPPGAIPGVILCY